MKKIMLIITTLLLLIGSNVFAQNDSVIQNTLASDKNKKSLSLGVSMMPSVISFKNPGQYGKVYYNYQTIPQINLSVKLSRHNFIVSCSIYYFQATHLNDLVYWNFGPSGNPNYQIFTGNFFNIHLLAGNFILLSKKEKGKNPFYFYPKIGLGYQNVYEIIKTYKASTLEDLLMYQTKQNSHYLSVNSYFGVVYSLTDKLFFAVEPAIAYFLKLKKGIEYNNIMFISGINFGIMYKLGKQYLR